MTKKQIVILHLYPKDMSIYGDYGNILTLKRRLEWHGYEPVVLSYNQGDKFPDTVDIIVGGGGQDSGQDKVKKDLAKIGPKLKDLAKIGTPMLMVCGLYQLFGQSIKNDNDIIRGIGVFDVETIIGENRLNGNVVAKSSDFGNIIGYENHRGQTFLGKSAMPLGIIQKGVGNNTDSNTEGTIHNNVIGSYLHGSLLPKNPKIADFLIEKAAIGKYGKFESKDIDDSLADAVRKTAMKRSK